MRSSGILKTLILFIFAVSCSLTFAANWPQWRGINRDGKSPETGLMKKWPEGGPNVIWSVGDLGDGHSSVSVADGMIYITGIKENEDRTKIEYITAIDLKGNIKWQKPYGKAWQKSFSPSRTTPTIDDGCAYVISGIGEVACIDIKTGEKKWFKETIIEKEQHGRWGHAESPLVVDGKVISTPGSLKATIVAYNKKTGKKVWASKSLGDKAAYCSPIAIKRGGKTIIIVSLEKNLIGVNADNGEILWTYDLAQYQQKIRGIFPATPIYKDGSVFVNGGYNTGGLKVDISDDGTKITKAWFSEELDTHIGGVVLIGGYLYGTNWHSNKMGNWLCVDWKTGKVIYDIEWNNKGQIIYADGMLYCYDEKEGNLGIAEATPKGFNIVSSFQIEGKGVHWMHPAISDGVLYVRHNDVLTAYDIKAK